MCHWLKGFTKFATSSDFWMAMVKIIWFECVSEKFSISLIQHCNSDSVMESEAFRYMKKCEALEACYQQERRRNYICLGFVSWIIYSSTVRECTFFDEPNFPTWMHI
nr:hypothetical protein CFP56_44018 [Quercus suber]